MDKANRASKHSFTPLIWSYPTFTIANDGTVWMGETDDRRGDVTAVTIARDGTVRRSQLSSPDCSSIRFTVLERSVRSVVQLLTGLAGE